MGRSRDAPAIAENVAYGLEGLGWAGPSNPFEIDSDVVTYPLAPDWLFLTELDATDSLWSRAIRPDSAVRSFSRLALQA